MCHVVRLFSRTMVSMHHKTGIIIKRTFIFLTVKFFPENNSPVTDTDSPSQLQGTCSLLI